MLSIIPPPPPTLPLPPPIMPPGKGKISTTVTPDNDLIEK
jgi:hypothetical protein